MRSSDAYALLENVVTPPCEAIKSIWIKFLSLEWVEIDIKHIYDCSPTKSDLTLGGLSLQCQVASSKSKAIAKVIISPNLSSHSGKFVSAIAYCFSILTSSSSSSIAYAQVIRVAHSGWRSSCYVDSGFLAFLLFQWYFLTGFSGCRGLLQILCCILFSHGVFIFPGNLAGYVAGFLFVGRIACRIGLSHIRFCSLLVPSSLMLWFWLWHYTVFCLIYPCILV